MKEQEIVNSIDNWAQDLYNMGDSVWSMDDLGDWIDGGSEEISELFVSDSQIREDCDWTDDIEVCKKYITITIGKEIAKLVSKLES